MLQVAFPQAEATRGMALNVRLVEEASPGGLVLSAGLMSGRGSPPKTDSPPHLPTCRAQNLALRPVHAEARSQEEV